MPRLPKNPKIRQKTLVLAIFGPRVPPGPYLPYFPMGPLRCAVELREAQFTRSALRCAALVTSRADCTKSFSAPP